MQRGTKFWAATTEKETTSYTPKYITLASPLNPLLSHFAIMSVAKIFEPIMKVAARTYQGMLASELNKMGEAKDSLTMVVVSVE